MQVVRNILVGSAVTRVVDLLLGSSERSGRQRGGGRNDTNHALQVAPTRWCRNDVARMVTVTTEGVCIDGDLDVWIGG